MIKKKKNLLEVFFFFEKNFRENIFLTFNPKEK